MDVVKPPRTFHLQGSGLGDGVPFAELHGRYLVVEEKVDDAHLQVFREDGALVFAHRGSPLTGGEREFAPVKAKLWSLAPELESVLGDRYELHGGSLYAKHTAFYDALPDYFLEYDVRDRKSGHWLATSARRELLAGLYRHSLRSVAVLHEGSLDSQEELEALLGPSRYKTPNWREALKEQAQSAAIEPERALRETDDSDRGEGLYVKVEDEERVLARYKWVRRGFLETLLASGSHWATRPLLANRLADADGLS